MSYLGQQLGQGQAERFVFTASGGETSVTTSDDGRAIAYTVGQVDVYLNGAKLINGSDFTATTGTSITGLAALTASDVVEVFALSIFQASDTVSAASGGTFNGNITIDANLSVTGTVDIDTSLNVDGTVTADGASVTGSVAGDYVAAFENTNATNGYGVLAKTAHTGTSAYAFGAYASSTALMVVRGDGNVGIGTSSPSDKLTLDSGQMRLSDNYGIRWGSASTAIYGSGGAGTLQIYTNSSERARIDSSGNLLVGGTSAFGADTITLAPGGFAGIRNTSGSALELRRDSTDGSILDFQKDGSTVGSIGTRTGRLTIGEGDVGLEFVSASDQIRPHNMTSNANRGDAIDLGESGARFKDLYLSGGVYLGGTGAANKLDDYETGTWTPNGNWSATSAFYVKIGDLVHLSIDLQADGTGGTSQITNLPFASQGTVGTGIYVSSVDWAAGYTSPTFVVAGTTGYFRVVGDNQAFTSMGITANGYVHLSITYQVA